MSSYGSNVKRILIEPSMPPTALLAHFPISLSFILHSHCESTTAATAKATTIKAAVLFAAVHECSLHIWRDLHCYDATVIQFWIENLRAFLFTFLFLQFSLLSLNLTKSNPRCVATHFFVPFIHNAWLRLSSTFANWTTENLIENQVFVSSTSSYFSLHHKIASSLFGCYTLTELQIL